MHEQSEKKNRRFVKTILSHYTVISKTKPGELASQWLIRGFAIRFRRTDRKICLIPNLIMAKALLITWHKSGESVILVADILCLMCHTLVQRFQNSWSWEERRTVPLHSLTVFASWKTNSIFFCQNSFTVSWRSRRINYVQWRAAATFHNVGSSVCV